MQGNILGQTGGGLKINGIIEEYKVASGGNVRTGDFVKFVNGTGEYGADTQLSTITYSGYNISAVELDKNKVFIAYDNGSPSKLYGIVCTINGTTITTGNDTQLSTLDYSGSNISAILLDKDKVFIAHNSNTGYNAYGIVCTINGTTITIGSDTQLSTITYSGYIKSTILLDKDKVFIAYGNSSTTSATTTIYLYGTICTINGRTITTGSDTQLSTMNCAGYNISAILLDKDKVFIAHGSATSTSTPNYLYGIVCTINGTTITTGSDTQLSTITYSGYTKSTILLDKDKVFIIHDSSSTASSNYPYGIVCTINGRTITAGSDTQLSTMLYSQYTKSTIQLDKNKVLIIHGSNSLSTPNYLYGTICTINGTAITTGTDTRLNTLNYSGTYISVIKLDENKVFIAYGSSSTNSKYLYGMVCIINDATITIETDTQLSTLDYSGTYLLAILLSTDKVFITHGNSNGTSNNSNYVYGIVYTMDKNIIDVIKNSTDEILGVTKTKGTQGQKVKVYVPKLAEYICTEEGNRIISENGEEIRNE